MVLSVFISLKSAYAILFTLSASANKNKVTRAIHEFVYLKETIIISNNRRCDYYFDAAFILIYQQLTKKSSYVCLYIVHCTYVVRVKIDFKPMIGFCLAQNNTYGPNK